MFVRFTAAALIGVTLIELTLYLAVSQHNRVPVKFFPCFLKSLPLVIGVIMLVRANALAAWIADKMDM